MANTPAPIGILFMAYGGPNNLDDIPGYLATIRQGRPTPQRLVSAVRRRYEQIGGASPLLARSQEQVQAVAAALDAQHFRCYLGMRHWAPWIEDVIRQMIDDGIQRAIALALAPHYSRLSMAPYHARIKEGLAMGHGHIDFRFIDGFHDAPLFIAALAARVEMGLQRWPAEQRPRVHVLFSAHSLPARIIAQGDPYDRQARETARLVAAQAGLSSDQWSFSYQSAGRSPEPWLGPHLDEYLQTLAAQGIRDIISVPVGFVCDHVETLYDIDIQAQQTARALGMRLERPPALNDDPQFIAALADLVTQHAAGW